MVRKFGPQVLSKKEIVQMLIVTNCDFQICATGPRLHHQCFELRRSHHPSDELISVFRCDR